MEKTSKKSGFSTPKNNTEYRRTNEESPFFSFSNAEIPISGKWLIDLEQQKPSSRKYLPLSNLRVVNNSSAAISIFVNQKLEGVTIPAGTIISLDRFSIGAFQSLRILSLDGSAVIDANLIKISCWREGIVIDQAFKRMHKAFFGFLGGK